MEASGTTDGVEKTSQSTVGSNVDESKDSQIETGGKKSIDEKMEGSGNTTPSSLLGKGHLEENGKERSRDAKEAHNEVET